MFVGGLNATNHALKNYSPLLNGYGRLFMVRPPKAIARMFSDSAANIWSNKSLFMQFKHIMEYMNRSVTGFQDKIIQEASTPIQGGFAGRQFNTPTVTKEQTNEFTVGLYELVGSPIYTVIDGWMNAIGDENSGLATYGGYIAAGKNADGKNQRLYYKSGDDPTNSAYEFNEANHTAEFIYVMHDRSGAQVERAVLLADCYPKGIAQGNVLNMEAGGNHDNVTYDVTFNCVMYRSPIITAIAQDLLRQYRIVSNSLNFNPELGDALYKKADKFDIANGYKESLGAVPSDNAVGTNIGNMPVYRPSTEVLNSTVISNIESTGATILNPTAPTMVDAKAAGWIEGTEES